MGQIRSYGEPVKITLSNQAGICYMYVLLFVLLYQTRVLAHLQITGMHIQATTVLEHI